MLISVFKNHENSSPSVVLLTGYSDDLSVNSIKRGTYLTNVYYQKKENKTIVYVKSSAYVYISTLCIGMNGSLKLSHENNLDLPSDAIEIPISWQEFSNIWELGELLENRLVKCKEMNIGANEIIDTGVNTGLIRFKINATSASCVFFCNSGSSNIMLITQNIDNYFTTNKSSNSGKIALYKESDNGNILIKNLTAINYGTFVFYYI